MEYKWPLSIPQFSTWDKLKLVHFLLSNDRWTQGEMVHKFEDEMAKYVGVKHAVFTSSGSTANTLLAMYLQDKSVVKRDTIVFPSTTWITSVSPFVREGFAPYFIDINLSDFSMDLKALDDYLKKNHDRVACVFVTSLIGFTPDVPRLKKIAEEYNVHIMMDNCENTLGRYYDRNVSSFFTSTTSTYFGHQIQSVEGGFVFTDNDNEHDYFLMARNHGMLRHLSEERIDAYRNHQVNAFFDFHMLGNNFRNTNINAFLGSCDLKRADEYLHSRRQLYHLFRAHLNYYLILPAEEDRCLHAPFCLPLVLRPRFRDKLPKLLAYCTMHSIEYRPIISGNLLKQTCFKRVDSHRFINSEYLHQHGFYIGLHGTTQTKDVVGFCRDVDKIFLE